MELKKDTTSKVSTNALPVNRLPSGPCPPSVIVLSPLEASVEEAKSEVLLLGNEKTYTTLDESSHDTVDDTYYTASCHAMWCRSICVVSSPCQNPDLKPVWDVCFHMGPWVTSTVNRKAGRVMVRVVTASIPTYLSLSVNDGRATSQDHHCPMIRSKKPNC